MKAAALALLVLAAGAAGCGRTHRVSAPAGAAKPPKVEAPDSPKEQGVPPRNGSPRVPASPEALLAEGAVGEIQAALEQRGLLGKHRRGELDPPTSAALRRFQGKEGLAETGFPDRETLARLGLDPEKVYGRAGDAPR